MIYSLLALSLIAVASACDVTAVASCYGGIAVPTELTKDSACDYMTAYVKCISDGGCCDESSVKAALDIVEKTYAEYGCSFTCASAPCFARDTLAQLSTGETLPMSEVTAGDYVLPGPTRVIVNQHKDAAQLQSSLLKVEHAEGSLSLTPDHVLNVDGSFVAAREAVVGTKLGNSEVSRVTPTHGGIINPLTTSGQIMADGVLASTYPEWIAGYMLGRSTASVSSLLSFLFPATTQAYYDAHLEQFFQSTSPTLASLATLPAPVVTAIFLAADLAVAAGFVAFSLASLKSVVALFAVGAALQSRK